MIKRELGQTGMLVTKFGFGGIPLQRVSDAYALKLVSHALAGGINWIDTANGYGSSEGRIGKAIAGCRREGLYLFTKAAGRNPETLRKQIELSLERLATSYLDLFQFHIVPDLETWKKMHDNGTVDLVLGYKEKGLIRHVGASAHTLETVLALLDYPEIEVVQWPFNFLVEEEGLKVLEKCLDRGVGLIGMKPFAGGVLNVARLCIRYLLQYPYIVADPGFETIEEVDEVITLADAQEGLSETDLLEISRIRKNLGTVFCRRCGYCSPCPHGVQIISLMTMESVIKRFSVEQALSGWAEAAASAVHCIECGRCEEKCPYDLAIMEQINIGAARYTELEQAAKVL